MNDATGIPWNCGTIAGTGVPVYTFRKPSIGGDSFVLQTTELIRTVSSASSGQITNNDLVFLSTSGATTISDYYVNVSQLIPDYIATTITSSNTGILLNPVNGVASGVSAGTVTITASGNEEFAMKTVTVSSVVGTTNTAFSSYAVSSLAYSASSGIDNRLVGKNSSTDKSIFTTQNHASGTYVRNSGCWAYDLDLTPISPWNSTGQHTRAGTLISPRHIIFAAHYQINNGATVRFVTTNNTVVNRTMINKLTHPSYSPYYPDITVGVLDEDVPNTIGYAKILPVNYASYLPSLSSLYRVPALALDYEEKALVTDLYSLNNMASFITPTNSQRLAFFETIISGDSGNPVFLIINGQLVILTVWTFGGAGSGSFITTQKDAINTMMTTLGGGYSLTEVALTGFTSYN